MQLLVPVLDTCFWHDTPDMFDSLPHNTSYQWNILSGSGARKFREYFHFSCDVPIRSDCIITVFHEEYLVTMQMYSSGIIWRVSSANWPLWFGSYQVYKWSGNHTYWSLKYNWGTQSKTVFKICERIWCSSFYVEEFDVIIDKNYFLN